MKAVPMDMPQPRLMQQEPDAGAVNAPGLPLWHCRGQHDGVYYHCEAAQALVSADDCRACSIPEAVAHRDACLNLVPLRHQGEPRYACRWFFSGANEPTADDWRKLCFCPYWFPRGRNEVFLVQRMANTRGRYLRVLRGEEPRRKPREPLPNACAADARAEFPFQRWWRSLLQRLYSHHE
jgi:hypothetical protein